ncbi:MAG: universal stress protein [Betaproteobacteria bacterium]|nr:universal stress protein [Betaproteobacteria bacterium]MBK8917159.1 universal stress protein [Betaproteobacteria bacterium]
MNAAPLAPTPAVAEHDADHRLVCLVYDSTPPLAAPAASPWLIAVDPSDNALRAVTHAATQAAAMSACALHLVHVQPWLSREAAEAEFPHRALAAAAPAIALLDAARLPWRLHAMLGDPAERIVERAVRLHATAVVIGSRGLGSIDGLLFGSVAYKVMHRCPLPVVLVP